MSNKENISDKELKQEAPLLFSQERKQTEAPEGYFDELADKVMASLETPIRQLPVRPSSLGNLWKVAAGIAMVVGMYFLLNPEKQPVANELSSQELQFDIKQDMEFLLEIEDEILYNLLAEQSSSLEEEEIDERIEFLMEEEIELDDIVDSL